ncbi:MAG: L,D-transpeptidase [Anaerolineae bacterium]|nr:L,D-transpeptidase [Anaerolineae bacterium]
MPSIQLTRRDLLRLAGAGTLAGLSLQTQWAFAEERLQDVIAQDSIYEDPSLVSWNERYENPPILGRVHGAAWIRIFKGPSVDTGSVRTVYWGYIMPIYRGVHGVRYNQKTLSDIWFETADGYVHSAFVVPCHETFQPTHEVSGTGFWGEVTVPLARQFQRPALNARKWEFAHNNCYYGQVHRVIEAAVDDEGNDWYRLYDDVEETRQAWVLAKTIRKVETSEFEPITPEVENKRITIDLPNQLLTCYEDEYPVFETRIASGTSYTNDTGEEFDFSTPYGDYTVQRKRPSRRMRGGDSIGLSYDVNGVPWCTYFSFTGAAIHGAYWHNNFGLPRSHGCINVTPDAAKWVYRWSQPYLTYDEDYRWVEPGELATKISII